MPEFTGKLADPAFRRERARRAGSARTTVDHHIKKVVDAAPTLTADQVEKLRGLLAPIEEVGPDVAA